VIVEGLQRSCKQNYQHSGRNKRSAVSPQENPICRDYLLKAERFLQPGSVGSHEIVLHGTRFIPDERKPGGCST